MIENKETVCKYRVGLVVCHLGWVDIDFGHSTICLLLLWQMTIWLNQLGTWPGKNGGTSKSKSTKPM